MEELLALARDCSVTITTEGDAYRFEARKKIGGKEYGCAFLVPIAEAGNSVVCIVSRRLKEMKRAMDVGLADAP